MPTTTTDSLFEHCEELQGDKPWGTILDSGTGSHSLRWLNSLANNDEVECDGWVAITADEDMRRRTQEEVDSWGAGAGKVIIGNWAGGYDCNDESVEPESNCNTPPKPTPVPTLDLASLNLVINKTHNLLRNQKFQTILCDYLICDRCNITLNKNCVPGDRSAITPGGVRIGSCAMTTRMLVEKDFETMTELLVKCLELTKDIQKVSGPKLKDFIVEMDKSESCENLRKEVNEFATTFPMPGFGERAKRASFAKLTFMATSTTELTFLYYFYFCSRYCCSRASLKIHTRRRPQGNALPEHSRASVEGGDCGEIVGRLWGVGD